MKLDDIKELCKDENIEEFVSKKEIISLINNYESFKDYIEKTYNSLRDIIYKDYLKVKYNVEGKLFFYSMKPNIFAKLDDIKHENLEKLIINLLIVYKCLMLLSVKGFINVNKKDIELLLQLIKSILRECVINDTEKIQEITNNCNILVNEYITGLMKAL